MAGQIFDRIFVFGNGGLLGKADRISFEYQGSPIPIATLAEDYAGIYPVPKHLVATIDQFVPVDGSQFDPTQKWLDSEQVTIKGQLGGSGMVLESDGFVDAPSIVSSPTEPTKLQFKALLQAVAFK